MCIFTDQFLSFPEEGSHGEIQKTNDCGSKVYLYFIAPIRVEASESQKETKEDVGGAGGGAEQDEETTLSTREMESFGKRGQNSRHTTLHCLICFHVQIPSLCVQGGADTMVIAA